MRKQGAAALAAVLLSLLAGCDQVDSAVGQANGVANKAAACGEALGLADLNPLVDPEKIKARAADKARRLRELAGQVEEQDVKNALFTMADSYVEVQKERFDDLGVVGKWAERNVSHLEQLRKACL